MIRAVATSLPSPTGHIEAAAWFIASLALTVASLVLRSTTHSVERDECARTHRERACQAQRNASIFADVLVICNGGGAIVMLLPLVDAGPYPESLTTHAALCLVLSSVWYIASTVSYAPLPRLPDPAEDAND